VPNLLGKLSRGSIESATNPKLAIFDRVAELIAAADYLDLTPRQRVAQLALIYDNEVCNGGHLQYFHNQGMDYVGELLLALEEVGATCQYEIFAQASRYALTHPVQPARTLEEYHERTAALEFQSYDRAYYDCRPELSEELLPAYIHAHLDEFIELE
jgi:hypothetical protein